MKKIILLIFVVFVLTNFNTAFAQETKKPTAQNPLIGVYTAQGFLSVANFQKLDNYYRTLFMAGFYSGLGVATAVTGAKVPLQWFKIMHETNGITIEQIEAVVSSYLAKHPEKWHQGLNRLCIDALWESFGKKQSS